MDYIELLAWVDENMEWVPSKVTMNKRYTDPFKILENGTGRGRCGEHSYVYAAACWARAPAGGVDLEGFYHNHHE